MQKYYSNFLQGYPLKTFQIPMFLKYWNNSKYFSFRTTDFFLTKSSISGFSCFKNLHIYTCKKNCIKSLCPLTARGGPGGVKALADTSDKNAMFFHVLPYLHIFPTCFPNTCWQQMNLTACLMSPLHSAHTKSGGIILPLKVNIYI